MPPEILRLDVWIMLAATGLLIAFSVSGWRLTRGEGAVFLCGFAAYIVVVATVRP